MAVSLLLSQWPFIYPHNDSVRVFELLLSVGFAEAWNSTPIPRNDESTLSAPRSITRHRSLDTADALGLILHHINSTMADFSLQVLGEGASEGEDSSSAEEDEPGPPL